MIKKSAIAYIIFLVALCYIIWPWFFEKKLLFNELLAFTGLLAFAWKRFRIGYDIIPVCILLLLCLGMAHSVVSLIRMDTFYYYLRNVVIVYSIFPFFLGFYLLKYLDRFITKIRGILQAISAFILVPLPRLLMERFNMSIIFHALFKKAGSPVVPVAIIILNIVYGIVYDSFTTLVFAAFLVFLFISPGYKFFKQVTLLGFAVFAIVFVYLLPNLSLINNIYNPYSDRGIHTVMESNKLLSVDGNSTWRLVLWKQIIVDNFPGNIPGYGFGTPMLRYYPVEDYSKLSSLPYVLGAHNSFVYLFGRLGIGYVILIILIYRELLREYFYYKNYYYSNNQVFLFWSFFASTIIALFNPALESPIFAGGYWLLLGFTARAIYDRKYLTKPVVAA